MITVGTINKHKSISQGLTFEPPDFCVLTGKNGSGKSHLFEAMADRGHTNITIDGAGVNLVQYIMFNGLNPIVGADCAYRTLLDEQKNMWGTLKQILDNNYNGRAFSNTSFLKDVEFTNRQYLPIAKELFKLAHGRKEDITEELFNDIYTIQPRDAKSFFSSQFASIFKLYANRIEANNYNKFRNAQNGTSLPVLTTEEFEKKYGPKPWVLINNMMEGAGLNFRVNNPENQTRDEDFHLKLIDEKRGIEVEVNDLSTGERVLMSLALAIYNTNEDSLRPDILLLDEPDAALHPEFSKVLLQAINDSIVRDAGVMVVISTHSPTTVALSDESWIYQMEYGQAPRKVSKKQALSILLKDLGPLRVSVENRRQVFVENRNDAGYLENIYALLPKAGIIYPQFLPASTKNGSNCQDVITMVTSLRDKGNDLVYGIIDYDNHNKDLDNIFVLGGGKRYAIDNYILDPLFVALLLIREKAETFADIDSNFRFSTLHTSSQGLLQSIINSVCEKLGFTQDEECQYTIVGGQTFSVKKEYFTTQGHTLEDRIINRWVKLNNVKRGRQEENIFKNYVIDNIISEYPEFLSVDLVETLTTKFK